MNNGNSNLSSEALIKAVQEAISLLPDAAKSFHLQPVPSGVRRSAEGDWVVPIASGGSLPTTNGYELHRILSDLQHKVESQVQSFVSITLVP